MTAKDAQVRVGKKNSRQLRDLTERRQSDSLKYVRACSLFLLGSCRKGDVDVDGVDE
jgi:hypothetical protein